MKKQKPSKETIFQHIYDSGIDKTCQLFSISEQEVQNILYPDYESNPKIRTSKNKPLVIKSEIADIIAKNYDNLLKKYVKDKAKLSMCQTSEDVFHNTLVKVMEELSQINEKFVLDYIEYKLRIINFQIKQDQKDLYKHQIYLEDAYTQESCQTEEQLK